jgi:hypothetical protein
MNRILLVDFFQVRVQERAAEYDGIARFVNSERVEDFGRRLDFFARTQHPVQKNFPFRLYPHTRLCDPLHFVVATLLGEPTLFRVQPIP